MFFLHFRPRNIELNLILSIPFPNLLDPLLCQVAEKLFYTMQNVSTIIAIDDKLNE